MGHFWALGLYFPGAAAVHLTLKIHLLILVSFGVRQHKLAGGMKSVLKLRFFSSLFLRGRTTGTIGSNH